MTASQIFKAYKFLKSPAGKGIAKILSTAASDPSSPSGDIIKTVLAGQGNSKTKVSDDDVRRLYDLMSTDDENNAADAEDRRQQMKDIARGGLGENLLDYGGRAMSSALGTAADIQKIEANKLVEALLARSHGTSAQQEAMYGVSDIDNSLKANALKYASEKLKQGRVLEGIQQPIDYILDDQKANSNMIKNAAILDVADFNSGEANAYNGAMGRAFRNASRMSGGN